MQGTRFEVNVPTTLLAYGLVTEERISSGKAAQLLGISRAAFLALLRKRGIAYIDYSAEDLADEFEAGRLLDINQRKLGQTTRARLEGSL